MNNLIGQTIDNYRLDSLLGEGGMGAVYRAQDVNLNRPVALKVMHGQLARQPEFQQRFMQEAQAAARLSHPSIVNIYHFGVRADFLYMVMEFVPGLSLGHTIRRLQQSGQVIEIRETLAILAQVADALGYAHKQGIVHRDIKPDNILLRKLEQPDRPGEPPIRAIVTDFGLAKLLEGGINTATGTFMGTLPYMSPEQCLGQSLDGRSDLYSLGVMMYQLTTGQLPFDIKSPTDAVMKHMREMPPAPSLINPGLPKPVEAVIKRAIAKQPDDRFATGEQMAQATRQSAASLTAADVTTFAPPQNTLSIMTQLLPDKAPPLPSHFATNLTALPYEAQLIIAQQGAEPRTRPLDKQSLTIGRSSENDLSLTGEGVSRHHARIERTSQGWQVIDMGSTNGTFLDGGKLLPNVPHLWEQGQVLRVGPFHLRWRSAAAPQPFHSPATYNPTAVQPIPAGATQVLSSSGQITIVLNPTEVELLPGERAIVQVDLLNQGMTVEHFRLNITDIPADWLTIAQDTIQLMPGGRGSLTFTLHPPRSEAATAGPRPFRLRVVSTLNTNEAAAITGKLILKSYSDFYLDMRPTQLTDGQKARLLIKNQGNAPAEFRVSGRDPGEAIRYQIHPDRLTIPPGERAVTELILNAKERPLLGASQLRPFTMTVRTASEQQKTVSGQLKVPPRLPAWVLPLLGFLVLLLCLAGGAAAMAISSSNRNAAATRTANATATAVAIALGQQELQATFLAATQTAEAAALTATHAALPTDTATPTPEVPVILSPDVPTATHEPTPTHTVPPTHTFTPTPTPTVTPTETPFPAGYWHGVWESDCEHLACGRLSLTHRSDQNIVTGSFANGAGTLVGITEANHLTGTWSAGGQTGSFDFWVTPSGDTWYGNWNKSYDWCGYRAGGSAPDPCGIATWYGTWQTDCGAAGCNTLTLEQNGQFVEGAYANGQGRVEGLVDGTAFTGNWFRNNTNGSIGFYMIDEGTQFQGNYNNNNAWCGHRTGAALPSPCLGQAVIVLPPIIVITLQPVLPVQPILTLWPIIIPTLTPTPAP
ncbi:MAG: protein kinase [Anaerolineae bacterium]|nr:protein kinase [Anaerolineae bacterium]